MREAFIHCRLQESGQPTSQKPSGVQPTLITSPIFFNPFYYLYFSLRVQHKLLSEILVVVVATIIVIIF